jgi:hypothetical protein
MKTLMNIILFFFVMNPLFSRDDSAYEKAMKDALTRMNLAATIHDFQEVANQFERIADVKKESWLPLYHAAYARVMMAAMAQDPQKKDPDLDAAQQHLDVMENLEHDTVEKMALEGFLIMIRMSVDASRGMELGSQCAMIINQAYNMNKQNPRAVLMLAQFNFGSASYMGQDTSESCAMFDTAIELFDQAETGETDPFAPRWGKEMALMMKEQCK